MRYLLSSASRPVLARLALEQTLCAFDFDGTLAPIVQRPDLAAMRPSTRDWLARLAQLYPCVILSGRARADLLPKLEGIAVRGIIGNHGLEPEGGPARNARVARWKSAVSMRLQDTHGVWVEDKGLSLAVHYRQAPQRQLARRRILEAMQDLEGARIFGGKAVVNLVEAGAPNKGTALAAERDRLGCTWVLYVGDDENDEDAFRIDGNLVAVRIGRKKHSHAAYYLHTQGEIDSLLDALARFREE
jgi:trehalose 6-phosphate phosphatase